MKAPSAAGDWQPAFRKRLEHKLAGILPPAEVEPSRLHEAMRYATLGEGKRIRPLLVYATGSAIGIPPESLDAPAANNAAETSGPHPDSARNCTAQ